MRWLLVLLVACGQDDASTPTIAPSDYATTFTLARTCQSSVDHDVRRVRIFASPDAVTPYNDRATAFPTGAILVKEEYGRTDDTCTGPIVEITAMQRLDADWQWQRTDAKLEPIDDELATCSSCHSTCPGGYAGTCAPPP